MASFKAAISRIPFMLQLRVSPFVPIDHRQTAALRYLGRISGCRREIAVELDWPLRLRADYRIIWSGFQLPSVLANLVPSVVVRISMYGLINFSLPSVKAHCEPAAADCISLMKALRHLETSGLSAEEVDELYAFSHVLAAP